MSQFFQLKIQLKEVKPSVSRTILVDASVSFQKLHEHIQALFGLENYHMWEFQKGGMREERIAPKIPKSEMLFFDEQPDFEAKKTKLIELLKEPKDKVGYWYDFGDDWEMMITLEKIFEILPINIAKTPFLLRAKGPMLMEDIGGIHHFGTILEFYEYLRAGKTLNKEAKAEMDWLLENVIGENAYSKNWKESYIEMIDSLYETDWKTFTF